MALEIGSIVVVRRPFTEELAAGVVVEKGRDTVLVACRGEELEFGIEELTPKGQHHGSADSEGKAVGNETQTSFDGAEW
jgi:hypothetical protein